VFCGLGSNCFSKSIKKSVNFTCRKQAYLLSKVYTLAEPAMHKQLAYANCLRISVSLLYQPDDGSIIVLKHGVFVKHFNIIKDIVLIVHTQHDGHP
jgi:hypothetical protein